MEKPAPKDPLEGKTLEVILNELVAVYGWEELGYIIRINCFNENPSIKSSLTFLRRTPWARSKVERLYVRTFKRKKREAAKKSEGK
ncbi:MAG: VF530 family protein [Pseudobdellovibrio sp.]